MVSSLHISVADELLIVFIGWGTTAGFSSQSGVLHYAYVSLHLGLMVWALLIESCLDPALGNHQHDHHLHLGLDRHRNQEDAGTLRPLPSKHRPSMSPALRRPCAR